MTIYILTLFPSIFTSVFSQSIVRRAQDENLINIKYINIRDFALDKYKKVDDKPYGGGKGMLLKADVVIAALESIKPKPYSILLSASGAKYNQSKTKKYALKKSLAIICGRYEGVDARVEEYVDEIISIGNFILTGGEIAAMVITDTVTRLIPGVIHPESLKSESFSKISSLLEYPQYTRPRNFRGFKVPTVLLKGNHQKIQNWQQSAAIKRTKKLKRGK